MRPVVASVVEGHSEVSALPVLIRRLAARRGAFPQCPKPFRRPRSEFDDPDRIAAAARVAGARVHGPGGVLILVDSDDDCAVRLRERLDQALSPVAVRSAVVVAVREYEAWLLAGLSSLSGHRLVRDDAVCPEHPEAVRGAKKVLSRHMVEKYRSTLHQEKLTSAVDLEVALSNSRSLRRLDEAVSSLLAAR